MPAKKARRNRIPALNLKLIKLWAWMCVGVFAPSFLIFGMLSAGVPTALVCAAAYTAVVVTWLSRRMSWMWLTTLFVVGELEELPYRDQMQWPPLSEAMLLLRLFGVLAVAQLAVSIILELCGADGAEAWFMPFVLLGIVLPACTGPWAVAEWLLWRERNR